MSVNFNEQWVPEPELRELPPRRTVASDYPDHNRPNSVFLAMIAAAVLVAGLSVFVVGLAQGKSNLTVIGIALAVAGLGGIVYFPYRTRQYVARVLHLTGYGVPTLARILSAENISPDNVYGRRIIFQVTHPISGEILHKNTNADDRALPKVIPANVTALFDTESGDFELYCALPYRAIPKMTPVAKPAAAPAQTPAAESPAPAMGTFQTPVAPSAPATDGERLVRKPREDDDEAAPAPERIVRKPREADEDDAAPKRESYE
ncbi:MAG: hypothetical protein ACKO5K_05720 [Armatimonadota bacterium]